MSHYCYVCWINMSTILWFAAGTKDTPKEVVLEKTIDLGGGKPGLPQLLKWDPTYSWTLRCHMTLPKFVVVWPLFVSRIESPSRTRPGCSLLRSWRLYKVLWSYMSLCPLSDAPILALFSINIISRVSRFYPCWLLHYISDVLCYIFIFGHIDKVDMP